MTGTEKMAIELRKGLDRFVLDWDDERVGYAWKDLDAFLSEYLVAYGEAEFKRGEKALLARMKTAQDWTEEVEADGFRRGLEEAAIIAVDFINPSAEECVGICHCPDMIGNKIRRRALGVERCNRRK